MLFKEKRKQTTKRYIIIITGFIFIFILIANVCLYIHHTSLHNIIHNETTNNDNKMDADKSTAVNTKVSAPNQEKIHIITAQDTKEAILCDQNNKYNIEIINIPGYERIFGCSSLIEYRTNDGDTIVNFHLNEDMNREDIIQYAKAYTQNKVYQNKMIHSKEISLSEEQYSGIFIQFENNAEQMNKIILNKELEKSVILTLEIIEKNPKDTFDTKQYMKLLDAIRIVTK